MLICAKTVLVTSWAIWTAMICAFVVEFGPVSNGMALTAVNAGVCFVLILTGIHLVGYQAYKHQAQVDHWSSSANKAAIRWGLLSQLIVAGLAFLMLDGGLAMHAAMLSLAAYWLASSVYALKRRAVATVGDLIWIKYGFLAVFLIAIVLGPIYWFR